MPVDYFKLLSQHLLVGTEENHEDYVQIAYLWLRFKLSTSQV